MIHSIILSSWFLFLISLTGACSLIFVYFPAAEYNFDLCFGSVELLIPFH